MIGKRIPTDAVIPAHYPGLRALTWNRDAQRPISAADAFAIYERNWRHLDQAAMPEAERLLVSELIERFGRGVLLA